MAATQRLQDIFEDPDLLDFEDPRRRDVLAARYRVTRVPGTVSAARWLMFAQPVLPILVPILARAGGGGGAGEPTTTTTIAVAGEEAATQGGGGGAFFIFFLGFVALVVAVIVPAARLKRPTPGVRNAALAVEGLLLLLGFGMFGRGAPIVAAVFVGTSALVIGLLLAPATRKSLVPDVQVDSAARFDVRNLPELDR